MPNCRHCGARIEKFHKDRCPICGELNPLDGVSSETIEITSQIQKSDIEYKKLKINKIESLISIFGLTTIKLKKLNSVAKITTITTIILFSNNGKDTNNITFHIGAINRIFFSS